MLLFNIIIHRAICNYSEIIIWSFLLFRFDFRICLYNVANQIAVQERYRVLIMNHMVVLCYKYFYSATYYKTSTVVASRIYLYAHAQILLSVVSQPPLQAVTLYMCKSCLSCKCQYLIKWLCLEFVFSFSLYPLQSIIVLDFYRRIIFLGTRLVFSNNLS